MHQSWEESGLTNLERAQTTIAHRWAFCVARAQFGVWTTKGVDLCESLDISTKLRNVFGLFPKIERELTKTLWIVRKCLISLQGLACVFLSLRNQRHRACWLHEGRAARRLRAEAAPRSPAVTPRCRVPCLSSSLPSPPSLLSDRLEFDDCQCQIQKSVSEVSGSFELKGLTDWALKKLPPQIALRVKHHVFPSLGAVFWLGFYALVRRHFWHRSIEAQRTSTAVLVLVAPACPRPWTLEYCSHKHCASQRGPLSLVRLSSSDSESIKNTCTTCHTQLQYTGHCEKRGGSVRSETKEPADQTRLVLEGRVWAAAPRVALLEICSLPKRLTPASTISQVVNLIKCVVAIPFFPWAAKQNEKSESVRWKPCVVLGLFGPTNSRSALWDKLKETSKCSAE